MTKDDWIRKLTSRKFWAAIANFVTMLVIALGGAEQTATQITALIMAGAGVIAWIVAEGMADAASAANAVIDPFDDDFYYDEDDPPDGWDDDVSIDATEDREVSDD